MYLLSGDNNLVPFHLWLRKIVLESEKVYKYFVQDCRKLCITFLCFAESLIKRTSVGQILIGQSDSNYIYNNC